MSMQEYEQAPKNYENTLWINAEVNLSYFISNKQKD